MNTLEQIFGLALLAIGISGLIHFFIKGGLDLSSEKISAQQVGLFFRLLGLWLTFSAATIFGLKLLNLLQ